ncbi:hypothetical protein CDAR_67021 [Caerostris darwini]|uniref:Uncharacterized protein n=1 Tax=Caerostris darwini TaxID=1538125 RepID=A0AAV4QTD1_9ARAC|nr:hypothetical protein CDAR_67021 [Caerostris darwini]
MFGKLESVAQRTTRPDYLLKVTAPVRSSPRHRVSRSPKRRGATSDASNYFIHHATGFNAIKGALPRRPKGGSTASSSLAPPRTPEPPFEEFS